MEYNHKLWVLIDYLQQDYLKSLDETRTSFWYNLKIILEQFQPELVQIDSEGHLIWFALIQQQGKDILFDFLEVSPKNRRKGRGRRAVKIVEAFIRERYPEVNRILVHPLDSKVREFWTQCGYCQNDQFQMINYLDI